MVFKRVLKGIGRLMLTTAVMCGVGLFLCSSEVKAAVSASSNNGDIIITVKDDSSKEISSIDRVKLYKDSSGNNLLFEVNNITSEIVNDTRKITINKYFSLNEIFFNDENKYSFYHRKIIRIILSKFIYNMLIFLSSLIHMK